MNIILSNSFQNISKNIFWRFSFLFIFFYIVPTDLGYPVTEIFYELTIWDQPIIWIGDFFYEWEFTPDQLHRGYDSRFEFSRYIFVLLVSIIGTTIWLLVDVYLKKSYTNKLKITLQTIIRYQLGLVIIGYGLSKVFMLQFGTMGLDTMETKVGDLTSMGLMWKFMSFSKLIVMFPGWIEVIGGVLLFFRKTTFLGVMLLFVIMANVVLMDISFDVTVILYACFLSFMLIILLSTQLKSLYTYLVLNETTKPETYEPLVKSKKVRIIFKVILLSVVTYFYAQEHIERIESETINRYTWFTNMQTVQKFVVNGDTLASKTTVKKPEAWKQMIFNGVSYQPETFKIIKENNKTERFKFEIDSTAKTIRFRLLSDETKEWSEFTYTKTKKRTYTFDGIYEGDTIHITSWAKYVNDYNIMYYKGKLLFDDN
ncbi:hypothetical protein [uncultured Kordia sp.]|uniref:hypothetical protein n=1 Tax=uncultured Kordia sp. TaxID=507699 RepID=UPI00262E5F44|nr:hypothetical protein [uncultured Kordia sp.]